VTRASGGAIAPREADVFPVSPDEERLWLFEKAKGREPVYNVAVAVSVEGNLDVDALRVAVASVADRHEGLRTAFAEVDGRLARLVYPSPVPVIETVDLTGADAAECEGVFAEQARQPFDLASPPLWRLAIVGRIAPD
jgi:hypothetical protein